MGEKHRLERPCNDIYFHSSHPSMVRVIENTPRITTLHKNRNIDTWTKSIEMKNVTYSYWLFKRITGR